MMNNLEMLTSILDPKFRPEKQFVLVEKETDTHATMIVSINKDQIDYNHVLYRFDPNERERFFPYFSSLKHLQKICDYFLFVQKDEGKDDTVYVFAIELKRLLNNAKSSKSTTRASTQLNASKVFADFLMQSAQRIYPELTNPIKIESISINLKGKRESVKKLPEFNEKGHLIYNQSEIRLDQIIEATRRKKRLNY